MNIRDLILTALFTALTAAGAFIRIPVGPVPITLQLLFTTLSGVILGARLGALSQAVYVIIGLLGIPVFAGGSSGLSAVVNPTFGYLLGFIAGAFITGKICESKKCTSFTQLLYATLAGILAVYAAGVPYLYVLLVKIMGTKMSLLQIVKSGFLVFLPGDFVKCIIASEAGRRIIIALKREGLKL